MTDANNKNIQLDNKSLSEHKSKKDLSKNNKIDVNEKDDISQYPKVGYFKLQFTLMDKTDYFLYFLGILGALGMGACFPLFSIMFGDSLSSFGVVSGDQLVSTIGDLSLKLVWIGLGMFAASALNVTASTIVGNRVTKKIKTDYFRCLLRQEQGFFDSRNAYEYSTKVQAQIKTIGSGLGTKVSNFVMSLAMFLSSYIVGFITSWKLSLILLSLVPFMTIGAYCMIKSLIDSQAKGRQYFENAGGIAEEVLYNIKTVSSFGNHEYEYNRFKSKCEYAFQKGKYGGMISSIFRGFVFFFIFCSYAVAIGVGAKFINDREYNDNKGRNFLIGDVMIVLFTIVFGSFSLGQSAPNLKAISSACDSAREYFYIKERKPEIDLINSIQKPTINEIKGNISIKNLVFSYPSKKERVILNSISFDCIQDTSTAIVGETGSGKSTIVNLLERLYDPVQGSIEIDGYNLKNLNLEYYRSLIGYVPQEPVLFDTSLKENIIFGRENISDKEIEEACEKANVSEFLHRLDYGLDTKVGIKGSKLSGGQKQRVAIARAILKKPKFLFLDEATSALDYKSEILVKQALDKSSKGVTTVVIAHRLSTIKNANNIIVLNNGTIVEIGTHESLFNKKGIYYNLVKSQEDVDNSNSNNKLVNEENYSDKIINDNNSKISGVNAGKVYLDKNIDKMPVPVNILNPNENFKFNAEPTETNKLRSTKLLKTENIIVIDNKEEKLLKSSNEDLTLQEKKKKLLIEEKIKEKKMAKAKSLLWPIMFENPFILIIATLFASISGTTWPVYGLLLADSIGKLADVTSPTLLEDGVFLAGMFIILAVVAGIADFVVGSLFSYMGEHLAKSMRIKCYRKYLELHMGFFDETDNSPGALLTKLASDTLKINGIALSMFAVIIETVVTLIVGVVLALVYAWQLALICLGFVPFLIITSALNMRMQKGFALTDEVKEKELGNHLSECIVNTKTIYCFNMEHKAITMFKRIQDEGNQSIGSLICIGCMAGISQLLMFSVYAVTFYVGAILTRDGYIKYENMFKGIFTVLFAGFGLGMVDQYLGDMGEAKKALVSLYNVLSIESTINPNDANQIAAIDTNTFLGSIEFRNVSFSYPTRRDTVIFNNLSFKIENGQNVAFVGFSGSGKSTIIQLILRFYDVDSGEILINGNNIKDYSLLELRKIMGLVMQEPVLFKTNVYNNIKYGNLQLNDNEKLINCAKESLVPRIDQITPDNKDALPVSGGEKQRIAIARCMYRNPKILLLDEATSALDKNVEEEVQKALEVLMLGRTSVVIAHRLSTIVNSDVIFLIENGCIKEKGSHNELMNDKGRYYSLFTSVSGNNKKQ